MFGLAVRLVKMLVTDVSIFRLDNVDLTEYSSRVFQVIKRLSLRMMVMETEQTSYILSTGYR